MSLWIAPHSLPTAKLGSTANVCNFLNPTSCVELLPSNMFWPHLMWAALYSTEAFIMFDVAIRRGKKCSGPWAMLRHRFCPGCRRASTPLSQNMKTLTGKANNIYHLITMQCSAEKPYVLANTWVFFDRYHHPNTTADPVHPPMVPAVPDGREWRDWC